MEILVDGRSVKYCSPDQVEMDINFYVLENDYEQALNSGVKNVEIFMNDVFYKMNFKKEDLKTRSFRVFESTKYDYEKRKNIKEGWVYSQSATLKFDYSVERMAEFMERMSKLESSPKYNVRFSVKDDKQIKKEAIKEAYNIAKEKAEAIAFASGKELVKCTKVEFDSFNELYSSKSSLPEMVRFNKSSSINEENSTAKDMIVNTFVPEDVEITESLQCIWIAE